MNGESRINGNAADAEGVGLRYVLDGTPGIARLRRDSGFRYRLPDGRPVRDAATLARIRALAIPPAWTGVWICPSVRGHLQATGRDARGRKQYHYHASWRDHRDGNKYERLPSFARALPRIRRRVRADLRREGLPREKVVAAIVRLLEKTFIRVGNESYARENGSYGLTTLRNRHVDVSGRHIRFQFRGKSRKSHDVGLNDAQLARIIRRCRDLPGYELFQYVDDGVPKSVDAADVNAYLQQITGSDYSAKDFRTWGGTLLTGLDLARRDRPASAAQAKREITDAIRATASELGNTLAICRKCYVHPRVLEAYAAGKLARGRAAPVRGLNGDERRILGVIDTM